MGGTSHGDIWSGETSTRRRWEEGGSGRWGRSRVWCGNEEIVRRMHDGRMTTTVELYDFSRFSKVALIRKFWSSQIPDQSLLTCFLQLNSRLIRKNAIGQEFELVRFCESGP